MATAAHPADTLGPSRWTPGRIVEVVLGSVVALVGTALLLGGAALALAHLTLRDSDGFYTSSSERLRTPTRALTSEGLRIGHIDGAGADRAADAAPVRVRIRAASADGRPIFVGIGPDRAVEAYLRGVSHDEVTDVHSDPFSTEVVRRRGTERPAPPAQQRFWAADASGPGTQTADWKVGEGGWTAVVMNADGRPGIATDLSVGAKLGWLIWVGLGLIALGVLVVAGGGGLLWAGLRTRPEEASGARVVAGGPGAFAPAPSVEADEASAPTDAVAEAETEAEGPASGRSPWRRGSTSR
jgi:hypothetical protein